MNMTKELRCQECGANGFHVRKIEDGFELVCMTSERHKFRIINELAKLGETYEGD